MSNWVGHVGRKLYFPELTFVFTTTVTSGYGPYHLYKFEDPRGNALIWWTAVDLPFVLGSKVEGYAQVKDHNEYRGVRQTVLSHCNFGLMARGQSVMDFLDDFQEDDDKETEADE